ncbi:ABC transporter ATP-binding protein [Nocardiopsis sp. NRRL B-16309]|uniref:ABC transporter ATP-binding protein n=1 Tax=Nocardiopsis sp. NRRL B-16309 TaxID=1519494 RepID=UPI0009E6A502|nr:ABC transporter ATP-binding protein [Nocardiopsis sp. NRRL B-16309]
MTHSAEQAREDTRAAAPPPPSSPPPPPPGGTAPLRALLRPIRGPLAVAAVLQCLSALAAVVPLIAVVELARTLLADGSPHHVRLVITVAAVALAARFALFGTAGLITHLADNALSLTLRRRVAAHVAALPLAWLDRHGSGRVKRVVQDDVSTLHHLVAHALLDLVGAVVTPLAAFGYLLWVDWRLALITIAPLPLYLVMYAVMLRGFAEQMERMQSAMSGIQAAVVEFVRGIAVVKAFGRTGRAHAGLRRAGDDFADFYEEWVRPMLAASAVGGALIAPTTVLLLVLAAGTGFVAADWIEPVDVLPFALLGLGLASSVQAVDGTAYELRLSREAASRVQDVLGTPPLPMPRSPRTPADSTVAYRGVRFQYEEGVEALRGIDLELVPGSVTALVGRSGSGKSTVARLLPRFADPTGGAITLGGVDLRELDPRELYGRVSFVFQDTHLLRDTVRANIALGRPNADQEEIEAAARAARVHDLALALPRGYDTVIGEDAELSGGEAQRVCVARALLADPDVLVLDEATSYADPETDADLQDALSALARGRTLMVIAHRLGTVVDADQILVVDEGRIVQRGRHGELLADTDGVYARLWASQEHGRGTAVTGTDAGSSSAASGGESAAGTHTTSSPHTTASTAGADAATDTDAGAAGTTDAETGTTPRTGTDAAPKGHR